MLETTTYIFLGLIGFFAVLWAMMSMGVISTRDHNLYTEREKYIEQVVENINQTYHYLEDLPHHNRDKIKMHLDRGEVNQALDVARSYHDVYHFFRNY